MGTERLEIMLDATRERGRVEIPQNTSSYVDMLAHRGYGYIRLTGLAALRARGMHGVEIDSYEVSIDPDAQLLLDHARALEKLVVDRSTDRVWTYIGDGCFEFNAAVVGDIVHVRVGIFWGPAFEEPFKDSVTIDLQAYLHMWRGVAQRILDAAQGTSSYPRN
jgi:hypothetical protein